MSSTRPGQRRGPAALHRRGVDHEPHDLVVLQLEPTHRGVDQTGSDRHEPSTPGAPRTRETFTEAHDAALGQHVAGVTIESRAELRLDVVEEARRERVVERAIELRPDVGVAGDRSDADSGRAFSDERQQRVEHARRPDQVDVEDASAVGHLRRDPRGVHERPQRTRRRNGVGETRDIGCARHVATDTRGRRPGRTCNLSRSVQAILVLIDQHEPTDRSEHRYARHAHTAGGAGDDDDILGFGVLGHPSKSPSNSSAPFRTRP